MTNVKQKVTAFRPKLIPAASLFMDGYSVLADFLNESPHIPEDAIERQALKELLQFIASDHSILINDRDENEGETVSLAVQLAQHLMIPLVLKKPLW